MATDLKEILGIDISMYNASFFKKTIQTRMLATSTNSEKNYFDYLSKDTSELLFLKKALNNNYSSFFRNKFTFEYLEQIILSELINKKKKLKEKEIRIWSAGCSSGQEAYSLAILCNELSKNPETTIRYRIFATDISEAEITKATKGIYSKEALNNVTLKRVDDNFELVNNRYIINKELKNSIDFSTFDLLDRKKSSPQASIFGGFDIVFCSNLLFYYSIKTQNQILNKLNDSLVPGGYLIVGASEKNTIKRIKKFIRLPKTSILRKPLNLDTNELTFY